jgi:hypothetical protein
MKDRFPLLALGVLLLFGVLGALVLSSAKRGSFADDFSTFRSEPNGTRALYLAAEQRHLKVSRLQKDLTIVDKSVNVALIGVEFAGDPINKLLKSNGIFSLGDAGIPGFDDDEDDDGDDGLTSKKKQRKSFGVERISDDEMKTLVKHIESGGTVFVALSHPFENELLSAIGVRVRPAMKKLGLRTLAPAQPSLWTRQVERVESPVLGYLDIPSDATPLLVDIVDDEVVMALVPHGAGYALVLSAPALLSNEFISKADNAILALSIFSRLSNKRLLVIDEFHHGFTSERSAGEFAMKYGLHFAAAQLIFGLALWALALKRFGRPLSVDESTRTQGTDALKATARLYLEGKHHRHASASILKQLLAECASRAGMPPHSNTIDIAHALEARGHQAVANAMHATAQAAHQTQTEHDVVDVASLAAETRRKMNTKEQR